MNIQTNYPLLLPAPRHLTAQSGSLTLPDFGLLVAASELFFEANWLKQSVRAAVSDVRLDIVAHTGGHPALITLTTGANLPAQGYRLQVTTEQITISGADAAGVFYGCCTLSQYIQQAGRVLPCVIIEDSPDFPARGVMLDISRDKVPTLETLYQLIEKLASWKLNQVQLYTEHTFAYRAHPDVWAEASPLSGEEILALDAFCKQRHIDLVPNQNSLGHMERWLKHPRYLPLAEAPDGFFSHWGVMSAPTTLDPQDPGSIALIASLYDELLPHFSSALLNVGGDEPWELGQGKSKEAVEAHGGRVYLDFLLKLHELATQHGRQMQFWGDIIIHYPDLVPELPKDSIAMEWGYEGNHDFDGHCKLFAESGIPFYVCPGTSSWNTLVGRTDNMLENLQSAATNGLKHGAIGFLMTDWGDNGHWQPLSISYAGFAMGGAFSWGSATNQGLDLAAVLDAHVFKDASGQMGRLVRDLGNVYKLVGPEYINGQVLAYALQRDSREALDKRVTQLANWGGAMPDLSLETLQKVSAQVDAILAPLPTVQLNLPDADIIKTEYALAADLLRYAVRWVMALQEIGGEDQAALLAERESLKARQREVWLLRNRIGGLEDSVRRW